MLCKCERERTWWKTWWLTSKIAMLFILNYFFFLSMLRKSITQNFVITGKSRAVRKIYNFFANKWIIIFFFNFFLCSFYSIISIPFWCCIYLYYVLVVCWFLLLLVFFFFSKIAFLRFFCTRFCTISMSPHADSRMLILCVCVCLRTALTQFANWSSCPRFEQLKRSHAICKRVLLWNFFPFCYFMLWIRFEWKLL